MDYEILSSAVHLVPPAKPALFVHADAGGMMEIEVRRFA
jgi:hypothetical protein